MLNCVRTKWKAPLGFQILQLFVNFMNNIIKRLRPPLKIMLFSVYRMDEFVSTDWIHNQVTPLKKVCFCTEIVCKIIKVRKKKKGGVK